MGEAGKVGLSVAGIKPTDLKESEYYSEQSFALGFHGVYVQLVVFPAEARQYLPDKIIRVDNFDMKVASSPTAQYVSLDGTLQLKSYRYKASKADDLGKDTKACRRRLRSRGTPTAAPTSPASTPATASRPGGHS